MALGNGITLLNGSGGNIGVLVGPEGKFMVDSGIALSKPKLSAAITALGDGQVRYLVNTHYHWDHTDGNAWLHQAGATIISTARAANRLGQVTRVDDWNYTFQPLPASGLPAVKLVSDKTYQFGGQSVALLPVDPAHTDGDLYVHMRPADVLFLGDLFWNGAYPFIDNQNGGSIDGMIRALEGILMRVSDRSVVVPGHGPAGTRSELKEFRDMLVAIRANVATLKDQGKTLTQVTAAKPTAQYDARFGQFVIGPDLFTKIVYDGLK
ncbi:MAG: MBL fold metallo-hydrolase [Haliea sp.]|nr:MBL fold metallo-hydrolase [Haliea sp.]